MEMKYKLGLLAMSATMVLVGCGGGDDSSNGSEAKAFTGQFIDAPVEGLNYTCTGWLDGEQNQPTGSGITNASGEFTCNDGDFVAFFVGEYELGNYQVSEQRGPSRIVSPYNIQGGDASIDVAQLLQTLDDPSDGVIKIPTNFTALDNVTVKPGDTDFDTLIADALPSVSVLVTEDQARKHLDDTLSSSTQPPAFSPEEWFAGKTVYSAAQVNEDADYGIYIFEEATNASYEQVVNWKEYKDDNVVGEYSAKVDFTDKQVIFNGPEGSQEMLIKEVTHEYVAVMVNYGPDEGSGEERFYIDPAKAKAYYDSVED